MLSIMIIMIFYSILCFYFAFELRSLLFETETEGVTEISKTS